LDEDQERLIEELQNLRAFPDVAPGMEALKAKGHRLVAFSNGVEATTRILLERSGILRHLEGVVSVDDPKTFKPDPDVYKYLARRLDRSMSGAWLGQSVGRNRRQVSWPQGSLDQAKARCGLRPVGHRARRRRGRLGGTVRAARVIRAPLQGLAEKGTPAIARTADV
jgi:haloacid dehalogenase-like hydrolase